MATATINALKTGATEVDKAATYLLEAGVGKTKQAGDAAKIAALNAVAGVPDFFRDFRKGLNKKTAANRR